MASVLQAPRPDGRRTLRRQAEQSHSSREILLRGTRSITLPVRPDPAPCPAPQSPSLPADPAAGAFQPTLWGPGHARLLPWQAFPLRANSARNSICCVQNYGLFLAPASPRPRCKHRRPHRAERALQQRHGVWGCAGETDLAFLPLWGWNPPSTEEEKNKGIQEQTGRETRFPSLISPKRFSLLCTAVKASLPPFPDQRPAGVWEVVSARARARGLPDMVHNTACV